MMINIMRLTSIQLSENKNSSSYWELQGFELGKINLITAKNATGKTRFINIINSLSQFIGGRRKIFSDADYKAVFSDHDDTYEYSIHISNKTVVHEYLLVNGEERIIRNENETKIYYEGLKDFMEAEIPSDMLCITRRDRKQQPFFEKLFEWANNTFTYRFGVGLGYSNYITIDNDVEVQTIDEKLTENVHAIFLKGLSLYGDDFKKNIINDFNLLGYQLEDIGITNIPELRASNGINQQFSGFYLKEKDIDAEVKQPSISAGMFRALSLLIQLNYLEMKKISGIILIDDIGEGLDFDRSKKLIKIILEKLNKNFIQLIMTTNDRFVMNAIDLKYWCVIERTGQVCNVINYNNSKELFDNYEFTGLNNFDFLSSEFYKNGSFEDE